MLFYVKRSHPATVEPTLTPDDASGIVDELVEASTKSFPLGLFLLPTAKVEAIHVQVHNPQDRLTHNNYH